MFNQLPKNTLSKLKILAVYQMIGGLLGMIITIWAIIKFETFTVLIGSLFAASTGLYIFSLISGWLLWKQRLSGVQCSLINQYFQIIQFAIGGFAFTYISGAYFSMGIDLTESYKLLIDFGILSTWQINVFANTAVVQLSFNFVAILLVVFITHVKRDVQEQTMLTGFMKEDNTTL